jgi:DNA-binding transcriptional ArsR family regulator
MNLFDELRTKTNQYESLQLKHNPFSISPLFRNFRDKKAGKLEEPLFVLSNEQEEIFKILPYVQNKRVLVYGLFGVGKTSLIDALLYVGYNLHNRFCVRTIITEDNVAKAIQELLLSICFDLVWEISRKEVGKPWQALKKWFAERQYRDLLFDYLIRLAGSYTEKYEDNHSSRRKMAVHVTPFATGLQIESEQQRELKKSIQSYVEILPMRNVAEYLADFSEIVAQLGFKDIVIFIDEADHLPKTEEFLRFLTKSREILFCSGYTFFVAGSEDVAKYTEAMGAIFDKLVFLKPVDREIFEKILAARLYSLYPGRNISQLFAKDALDFIFENTGGINKLFLRMAENAVDVAAIKQHTLVSLNDCIETLDIGKNKITSTLATLDVAILRYLAKTGKKSPSDEDIQTAIGLKRVALRKQLEDLLERGYVRKEREGKKYLYFVASQYKSYFES